MQHKNVGCIALLLLAVVIVLDGCGDIANYNDDVLSDGTPSDGTPADATQVQDATPSEATQVQAATSNAISVDTITLNWELPADISGYLGVIITEESGAGSLLNPVELDATITEYTVTNLNPDTVYRFTITTRYRERGKNNDAEIPAMTASATEVQNVDIDDSATTSDSATITWEDPVDEENYTGVTISIASTVGDFDMNTPRMVEKDTNTLVISGLDAETSYTLVLTFVIEYSDSKSGGNSEYTVEATTQSRRVAAVTASDITENSLTLTWTPPEDAGSDYQGVTISAMPDIPEVMENESTTTAIITGLTAFTPYVFTITTRYSTATKRGADRTTAMIRTLSMNTIDLDGDALVDINSLEGLDNVRYNLDLGATGDDGRYKESTQIADGEGVLCGGNADTKCTGYELMRSLDFNDGGSYDSGIVNNDWRPNNADPAMATNAGWDPIGGDFATRFEGNGYTISNLYSRNKQFGGLFSITELAAVIRSIGMVTPHVYGRTGDNNSVGALVGQNDGTIVASYVSNGTVDGGTGTNNYAGGLVGHNSSGTIVASYATGTVRISGGFNIIGGLVGRNTSRIIASYASTSAAGGTGTSDIVGGLVGFNALGDTTHLGDIIASYANDTATGGAGASDSVGGLVGSNATAFITASYATGAVSGGADDNDSGGALVVEGNTFGTIAASYGFGSVTAENMNTIGAPPSSATTAALLSAPHPTDSTNTAVDAIWDDADSNTLNAWDFGDNTQPPALRYADYDGADTEYGCGTTIGSVATIPSVVAAPGGPLTITCGTTLLPEQEGR